jgi:hypothetical protein
MKKGWGIGPKPLNNAVFRRFGTPSLTAPHPLSSGITYRVVGENSPAFDDTFLAKVPGRWSDLNGFAIEHPSLSWIKLPRSVCFCK